MPFAYVVYLYLDWISGRKIEGDGSDEEENMYICLLRCIDSVSIRVISSN